MPNHTVPASADGLPNLEAQAKAAAAPDRLHALEGLIEAHRQALAAKESAEKEARRGRAVLYRWMEAFDHRLSRPLMFQEVELEGENAEEYKEDLLRLFILWRDQNLRSFEETFAPETYKQIRIILAKDLVARFERIDQFCEGVAAITKELGVDAAEAQEFAADAAADKILEEILAWRCGTFEEFRALANHFSAIAKRVPFLHYEDVLGFLASSGAAVI